MTARKETAKQTKEGLLSFSFKIFFSMTGLLFFSWILLLSYLAFFMDHKSGIQQVNNLLMAQLNFLYQFDYLPKQNWLSTIGIHPYHLAQSGTHEIYFWSLIKTHLIDFLSKSNLKGHGLSGKMPPLFSNRYQGVLNSSQLIIRSIELIFIRLIILFCMLPLFLVFGLIGLIDGFVLRDLRRFQGGHESTLIHHFSRSTIGGILALTIFIYLVSPYGFSPLTIFLPAAILWSLSISTTCKFYKKYG